MPHIHEKIDFTVSVYIVHKDKVLLRMHDKYHIWLGPGGHIELHEDPNEAVVREAKEEVGLDIKLFNKSGTAEKPHLYATDPAHHKELIPPVFLNRHYTTPTHEHVDLVYLASTESDKVVEGEIEKSKEIRWFAAKELDDPHYGINEDVKYYARSALKALSS